MQKLIILRGYPGSGKTTVGKLLKERGSGVFIDHNQILDLVAKFTENDEGIYDEIHGLERAMAVKLLNDGKSVIVARGFSSVASLEPYIKAAKDHRAEPFVFRLEVDIDNLVERVQAPERKAGFNTTLNEESLKDWISENPLVGYPGETEVNTNTRAGIVVSRIEKVIRETVNGKTNG